jgi:alpha-glucosidase
VCLVNLSGAPVPLPEGRVLLASDEVGDGAIPDDTAVWLQA